MVHFRIDRDALRILRDRAASRARAGEGRELLSRFEKGDSLADEELVALFLAREVPTDRILSIAKSRREVGCPRIGTFAPLYITNECDAECRMCGMRRGNMELRRETAGSDLVSQQLDILYRRGLRGVAVLSGEYRRGPGRIERLARASEAARLALDRGFHHVLINVGSIEWTEYEKLLSGLPLPKDRHTNPRLTMCTFQETYDNEIYAKFMGTTPDNPRSDFDRRLTNFDRAFESGIRWANPGLLLGLNPDLPFELLALLGHVTHLLDRGMGVYISLPRLRKANGVAHRAGLGDDDLARLVGLVAAGRPEAEIVISTREPPAIQRRLLPVIGVLTAGSPGVAPYSETSARFELDASQFEVADQRPFEDVLSDCVAAGVQVQDFEPSDRAPLPIG